MTSNPKIAHYPAKSSAGRPISMTACTIINVDRLLDLDISPLDLGARHIVGSFMGLPIWERALTLIALLAPTDSHQ